MQASAPPARASTHHSQVGSSLVTPGGPARRLGLRSLTGARPAAAALPAAIRAVAAAAADLRPPTSDLRFQVLQADVGEQGVHGGDGVERGRRQPVVAAGAGACALLGARRRRIRQVPVGGDVRRGLVLQLRGRASGGGGVSGIRRDQQGVGSGPGGGLQGKQGYLWWRRRRAPPPLRWALQRPCSRDQRPWDLPRPLFITAAHLGSPPLLLRQARDTHRCLPACSTGLPAVLRALMGCDRHGNAAGRLWARPCCSVRPQARGATRWHGRHARQEGLDVTSSLEVSIQARGSPMGRKVHPLLRWRSLLTAIIRSFKSTFRAVRV